MWRLIPGTWVRGHVNRLGVLQVRRFITVMPTYRKYPRASESNLKLIATQETRDGDYSVRYNTVTHYID